MDVWKADIHGNSRHGVTAHDPVIKATRQQVEDHLRENGFRRLGHWARGVWQYRNITAEVKRAAHGVGTVPTEG